MSSRVVISFRRDIFFIVALAAFVWWMASSLNYYLPSQDIFGVYFYAKFFKIAEPASLYNAFVPVGHVLTLSWIPFDSLEKWLHVETIFWNMLTLMVLAGFQKDKNLLLTAFVCFSVPINFLCLVTPTMDAPALFFVAFAGWVTYKKWLCTDAEPKDKVVLAVGVLLGCAVLFRYHAQTLLAAFLFFIWIFERGHRLKKSLLLLAGFLVGTAPQSLMNILSGHAPFSSEVAVNIYRTVTDQGLSYFYHFPMPGDVPSVLMLLKSHFGSVVSHEISGFFIFFVYAIPAALFIALTVYSKGKRWASWVCSSSAAKLQDSKTGFCDGACPAHSRRAQHDELKVARNMMTESRTCLSHINRSNAKGRFCRLAFTCVFFLSLAAATGGSLKAPLVLTVFYVVPLIWLAELLLETIKNFVITGIKENGVTGWMHSALVCLTIIIALSLPWRMNQTAYREIAVNAQRTEAVASFFRHLDPQLTPSGIYTDSLTIYFPGWPPYLPYAASKGWLSWVWGVDRIRPELDKHSWESFLQDANKHHIRYLMLDQYSYFDASFIKDIYFGSGDVRSPPDLMTTVAGFKIYQLR